MLFNKAQTKLIQYPSGNSATSYTIPNSVTSIGDSAFSDLNLTSITIPNSVISIGDSAFSGCDITSITIPNSVTSIGDSAFFGCDITSITIPNSVTSVGDRAFSCCYGLKNVKIGSGVKSIRNSSFSDCHSLTVIAVNSANKYYSSKDGVLFNKAQTKLIQYPIGKSAASYTIPNSVTSIGDRAFFSCSNLTGVTIGSGVKSIGDWAFYRCIFTSVTIPNSVTSIGNYAFDGCSNLSNVTIGSGVKSIGISSFSLCYSLTGIAVHSANKYYSSRGGVLFNKAQTMLMQYPRGKNATSYAIPNCVTSIGYRAFSDCNLTSITIPDSVTSIGARAFNSCSNLTSVTIPNSVTNIGSFAFSDCYSLKNVKIGSGVTSIGDSAFEDCARLTGVTIPNSVTSIGRSAFNDLKTIKILNPNCEIHVYAINSGATIYGYTGSTAQSFAKKNNNSFVSLGMPPVTGLKAAANASNSVRITWTKIIGATGYQVFKYNGKEFVYYKAVKTNSFTDTGLNPNSTVYYRVRAYKTVNGKNSYGALSGLIKTYTSPAKATGLKVSAYAATSLKLTWTKTAGATGHRLYKYNDAAKKWEAYRTTTANTVTVTGLNADTSYGFIVRAYRTINGKVYWGDNSAMLIAYTYPATR